MEKQKHPLAVGRVYQSDATGNVYQGDATGNGEITTPLFGPVIQRTDEMQEFKLEKQLSSVPPVQCAVSALL